ncbi:unnamed protein product [Owenia fusiformis]|uniref:Metalloendopeptidase n=1 Tax=Owenia fusiformis TaxID=6347 RepID=A0A8J1TR89_OWEFU|nr:unnamed protein product [Owenia fusiformis]
MKGLILLALFAAAQAFPSFGRSSPEEGDLFEGDIILDEEEDVYNALRSSSRKWPSGRVPYTVTGSLTSRERSTLNAAIADYNRFTCIRWVPKRSSDKAYVNIKKASSGCSSAVGRTGRAQTINLGRGCWNKGIVIHEMMHAIGFYHEQSRTDRDKYVTIMYDNIKSGKQGNFNKYDANKISLLGMPYDYSSVMHYGGRAFSKNGKATIVPKQRNARIGQRSGFSSLDYKKINKQYKC